MRKCEMCGTKATAHFKRFICTRKHFEVVLRAEIACGRPTTVNLGKVHSNLEERGK